MNSVAGKMGEGGEGSARADFVLGDRDGTTCDPAFTEFVRTTLAAHGIRGRVNDPYKGVELVRAYSDPARGRHSLQVEINKRLYMDEAARAKHDGFASLQRNLQQMIEAIRDYIDRRRAVAEHHPIEIQPPDIAPYRASASGVDYVHVLDSGRPARR